MIVTKRRTRKKLKAHHHFCKLMGCQFIFTAVHDRPEVAWKALRAASDEVERIEELISSWDENSQTAKINENAGKSAVKIDSELYDLIKRSKAMSELTSGAFDISGTLSRYYWNFNNSDGVMLPKAKIEELKSLINYKMIKLDESEQSVFLEEEGMKIGFGGIGKGYAALKAQRVMARYGISSGVVNAAGDLMCWGKPLNAECWSIKVPDPDDTQNSLFDVFIPYGSLVTSGDYEKFTIVDGKRCSHIVDPRTGIPAQSLKSVSVISPNPEFGDALATAVSVLGPKAGISLVNRLNGVECLVVDQFNKKYFSNHFSKLIK